MSLIKDIEYQIQFRKINSFNKEVINDFSSSLLKMDDRIKLCQMGYDIDSSGAYIPTKTHIIIPVFLPLITHEISHLVEINPLERLLQNDFGMRIWPSISKKFWVALAREVRVRAIESIIEPKPFSSRKIEDNSEWLKMIEKAVPYGKFKDVKEVIEWTKHIHNTTIKQWDQERIRFEWCNRLDYLREWMETK